METEESRWKKIFAAITLKALCRPNKKLKEKRRETIRQGEMRGGVRARARTEAILTADVENGEIERK